jgi:hypothetical protein
MEAIDVYASLISASKPTTSIYCNERILNANILQSCTILHKDHSTVIYVQEEENVAIKISNKDHSWALREYNVALLLNQNISNITPKPYALYQCPDGPSIYLFEYVSGQTVTSLLDSLSYENKLLLLKHIVLLIVHIQSIIKFTHYDAHMDNILVSIVGPTIYKYNYFGKEKTVKSIFKITLIDLELSYIDGLKSSTGPLSGAAALSGICPTRFDDFADLCLIITLFMCHLRTYQPLIIDIIRENGFIPYDLGRSMSEEYEGREYWDSAALNDIEIEKTRRIESRIHTARDLIIRLNESLFLSSHLTW